MIEDFANVIQLVYCWCLRPMTHSNRCVATFNYTDLTVDAQCHWSSNLIPLLLGSLCRWVFALATGVCFKDGAGGQSAGASIPNYSIAGGDRISPSQGQSNQFGHPSSWWKPVSWSQSTLIKHDAWSWVWLLHYSRRLFVNLTPVIVRHVHHVLKSSLGVWNENASQLARVSVAILAVG